MLIALIELAGMTRINYGLGGTDLDLALPNNAPS
jgi:hypothetical protein